MCLPRLEGWLSGLKPMLSLRRMEGQVPAPTWAAHDCLSLQFQGHVPLKSYACTQVQIHTQFKKKFKEPYNWVTKKKIKLKKLTKCNLSYPIIFLHTVGFWNSFLIAILWHRTSLPCFFFFFYIIVSNLEGKIWILVKSKVGKWYYCLRGRDGWMGVGWEPGVYLAKKGGGQNSLLTRLKLTEMDQSKQRHLKAFVSWKWLSVAGLASLTADWSSAWPSGIPNTPDLSPDEPGLGALAFPCVPLLSSLTSPPYQCLSFLPGKGSGSLSWRMLLGNSFPANEECGLEGAGLGSLRGS